MVYSHFESGAAGGWAAFNSGAAVEVTDTTATSDRTAGENLIDALSRTGENAAQGAVFL